jgi:hypothetical protein
VVLPNGWTAGGGRRFGGPQIAESANPAAFYQSGRQAGGGLFTKFFFSLD